jgi:3-isopropylmalate/(R)-2-methylmalate dehydratase small subunit
VSGRVFLLGDGVSTDAIMPGRYNVTTDPDALRRSCLIEARPDFAATVRPGDVIVAGRNFGCGSSREHAPLSIKRNNVAAVIAATFARIFYRNAVNIGLPVIRCADAYRLLHDGDQVTVDAMTGDITTSALTLHGEPPSGVALRIIESGSLVELIRRGGWSALEEERRVSRV